LSNMGPGVLGQSIRTVAGVLPGSGQSDGVRGESAGTGVHGISYGTASGVWGENQSGGYGVTGSSRSSNGVYGQSSGTFWQTAGVFGENDGGIGVRGKSDNGTGVYGESQNGTAATFDGRVLILGELDLPTGNINLAKGDINLFGADCAEDFEVSVLGGEVEPGTVVVINGEGALERSRKAYDKSVAGVISGAGTFRPGIILDRRRDESGRMAVALVGKVYCKADAQYGPIDVGDLLTTSGTPGYAMKASDPRKAFGAVIGKALRPLPSGQGLIPILIALQ
jgi:hypothetical protein